MSRRRRHPGEWVPLTEGAILGACSFVFGYLVMFLLILGGEGEFVGSRFAMPAWLYYNAQFAPVTLSASVGRATLETSFNLVTGSGIGRFVSLDVPAVVYHLVPAVILFLSGALLAKIAGARTPTTGAIAGVTVFVGTALVALPGAFLFSASARGISASPALLKSFVFAGVLFPAVFGAIGGAAGARL